MCVCVCVCVCVIILIVIESDTFHLYTPSPVSDMEFTYCNFHRKSVAKNSHHGHKGPCSKNDRMRMRLCLPCNEIGPFREMTHHIGCENLLTLDDLYCFLPMIEKCYLKHSKIQFLSLLYKKLSLILFPLLFQIIIPPPQKLTITCEEGKRGPTWWMENSDMVRCNLFYFHHTRN